MARKKLENDMYLAFCTVYGRTHHSIPTETQEIIPFRATEEEFESKLEEARKDFYLLNEDKGITEIRTPIIYKISKEITPKKISYETPLKQMYNSVD
jgi:hypothetical protein